MKTRSFDENVIVKKNYCEHGPELDKCHKYTRFILQEVLHVIILNHHNQNNLSNKLYQFVIQELLHVINWHIGELVDLVPDSIFHQYHDLK